jgi:hypothetical protein
MNRTGADLISSADDDAQVRDARVRLASARTDAVVCRLPPPSLASGRDSVRDCATCEFVLVAAECDAMRITTERCRTSAIG